jgi:ATP-dependent helicase HrpB
VLAALPVLPVSAVLDDVSAALAAHGAAVLVAPPGAGKTTLVPLHLMQRLAGRIILLEPRRVAARAAARRMAALAGGGFGGSEVGGVIGQAMRLDTRESAETRVLVVTEGVFTRMILADPELAGVDCVIFDEFHERSLDADFGLALAMDVRAAIRPDLKLLVMSATLDGVAVAAHLGGAPLIESEGRTFPVRIRYDEKAAETRIEDSVAAAIRRALAEEEGSMLAFLPGVGEIGRVARALDGRLPANVTLHELHGQLDGKAQDEAIRPAAAGTRKVVLATSIAQTALTIDGVRVVIDSGLARVPVFEPATGLTRLETVPVSRASADQRAGRAGRTAPGTAIRLWREQQNAARPAQDTPEILAADLTSLVMDCAAFGVSDPATLPFLDTPPAPALAEARALLLTLGALDSSGRLTQIGEAMRQVPLPARLAAMVAKAGDDAVLAAELGVLLTERGLGGPDADLTVRLSSFRNDRSERARRARDLARRIAGRAQAGSMDVGDAGRVMLHAFPDRVAMARGAAGRFVMANGRGVEIDETDRLAREPFLVVADLQGKAKGARILAAAPVTEADIRDVLAAHIRSGPQAWFDAGSGALKAEDRDTLGALVLARRQARAPSGEEAVRALLAALREHGPGLLPWTDATQELRARMDFLHRHRPDDFPAMDDAALLSALEEWLAPYLPGVTRFAALSPDLLADALKSRLPHDRQRDLNRLAPSHFEVPTGSEIRLRYENGDAILAVRVQEMFGLKTHPAILGGAFPLLLELLSPAHRPVQTTRDLAAFWAGSWKDVRADMRGRYPKHVWPDDPANAEPTRRAKPRGM